MVKGDGLSILSIVDRTIIVLRSRGQLPDIQPRPKIEIRWVVYAKSRLSGWVQDRCRILLQISDHLNRLPNLSRHRLVVQYNPSDEILSLCRVFL